MDTILLAVTVLSLAMAAGMAILVATLLRQERARSNARVAALSASAAEPAIVSAGLSSTATVSPRIHAAPPSRSQAQAPRTVSLDDLELRPREATVAGVSHLFATTEQPSPWGRRLAVIGALAAVVLAFGLIGTAIRIHPAPSPAASATNTPAANSAPLELLSLRHVQETERLVITGVVQNPRNGVPLSRVVATAFLFGSDGAFMTSSRAPLDFTTLAPGVESPFVVNVPVSGTVTRYRIGFRTEDGQVISHVDKRAPDALAQK